MSDGEEAISYIKGEEEYADRAASPIPDFMLCDLIMPRKNGFEVLEWIRADETFKDLMVHVFSASSREVDVKRVYELRANVYILKPSRMDELIAFIRSLITLHKYGCRVKAGERSCS